jgi:hypothetical protein
LSSEREQPRIAWTERGAVLGCCLLASLAAIAWSWRHGAMMNYGDAIAHLHIARRVLDSHRPGLTQLGSVWLPLPHLLMLPFVQVYAWWANGVAGTIPSALAYLASCAGVYRLARRWLPCAPAALALAFFALNPNLLYLQTTAMTEPLFVCETIWTAVWLAEWSAALDTEPHRAARWLPWILLATVAAVFTRYDGWIMSFLAWAAMAVALRRRGRLFSASFSVFTLALALAPVVWFAYNATAFGDWLYFARGPYSAAAIEVRTSGAASGYPPHPGWHNPWVALIFFAKAAELDAAAMGWANLLLILSALGSLWALLFRRRRAIAWLLLLWFPLPFYAYSISYGSVPIFMPVWWPHSWYNTRYGMELLPALALGLAFIIHLFIGLVHDFKARWAGYAVAVVAVLIAWNAWAMLRERPLTYVEGCKNAEARREYDRQIPQALRALLAERAGGAVLMNTSVYPELVSMTGIPLRQTINESDKEYYDAALAAPAAHAAVVLAFAGDAVDAAVQTHPDGLTLVSRFAAPNLPAASLYITRAPSQQNHE